MCALRRSVWPRRCAVATSCPVAVLWPLVLYSEVAALSDVESPGLVLGVTTPSITRFSELTNPGGASLVDDNEEDGLVLDPAILVLRDEDLNEDDVPEANDPHDLPRKQQSCDS